MIESINNTYSILVDKIDSWVATFISMLPNLTVAALVMLAAVLVSRGVEKLFEKFNHKFISNKTLRNLVTKVLKIGVLITGMFIALSVLQLNKAVTSFLAGAGIIGLALGFAFQDTAANFMSGLLMAVRKPFKVNDIIESGGVMGHVKKIDFRTTTLTNFNGQNVIIPNRKVFEELITNYVQTGERRLELEVGVSYGDDLDKVEKVAKRAIEQVNGVIKDRIQVLYSEFGSSSINMVIHIWMEYPDQPTFLKVRSESIKSLKKAFDKNDIVIPFPIRTLDFGIKGGMELKEALPVSIGDKEYVNN